jgi:hypothetical protein
VEVEFADGSSFHLSAEFLRVYSPAADSKIRSIAGEKVTFYCIFCIPCHQLKWETLLPEALRYCGLRTLFKVVLPKEGKEIYPSPSKRPAK